MTTISGHILVVDDNKTNRLALSLGLKHQGHQVTTANDGQQAIDLLHKEAFDLVLLDIVMPHIDGFAVLEHLKRDNSLRDIPVIVISALEEMDSVVKCIQMGAEDHLPKSFDPVLLKTRINVSLEKKRLRDQEIEYLRQVDVLTEAAAAVENETFTTDTLVDIVARPDALGQLARVFKKMVYEVQARENRLKEQVRELRIEMDKGKRDSQVAEITDSNYFQTLRGKAQDLRDKLEDAND